MENLRTIELLRLLISHWKKLLLVAIAVIGLSALFSSPLFITPDYRSDFIVYPTNLAPFGKESGAEQLFQFFTSDEVRSNLAKRLNLFSHYNIDIGDKKAQNTFNKLYTSNVQVKFTRFQSIEGNITDASPEFAQQLAKELIDEVNALIRKRKKEKYNEYLQLYTLQLTAKKNEIDSLENKLKWMRVNYGFLDINSQSKIVSKQSGKKELNETNKLLLTSLKEHSGEFSILKSRFELELENYKLLKQTYDKNLTDFNGELSYMTLVSGPGLPDKKNSPNRTLIVLFATLSALLLCAFFIIVKQPKRS